MIPKVPLRCLLAFAVSLLAPSSSAQFHAPDTRFHDLAQRFFPVEAARVLAWLERQNGSPVTEVSYKLTTSSKGETEWKIRWLDGRGQELKLASVRYQRVALTNGINFYREVFRQLGGSTNALVGKSSQPKAVADAFWDGASRAGYSRVESLEAAFDIWKLSKDQIPEPEQAARLAGLLAQTTTHGFWQESALDALMLARSAAWLCIAESSGATNTTLWSPIFFIAGREWQARAIWAPQTNLPVCAWWNLLMSGASAKEAFVFVASPAQRTRAMPMLAWHAPLADGYMIAAGHLVEPLFGNPTNVYDRLFDYAPTFSDSTVENGHIMNGQWPALAREAWLRTLKAYPLSDLDFRGFTNQMARTEAALGPLPKFLSATIQTEPDLPDASLRKLAAFTPLMRVAYDEGIGPLIPVAHVTARDLLHYGWENATLQLAARHHFVQRRWGVPELAKDIFNYATNYIPEVTTLAGPVNSPKLPPTLDRLQFVNWTFGDRWPAAGIHDSSVLTNDSSFMQRHWLRPHMTSWLYNRWFWAHSPEQRRPVFSMLHEEGGRQMDFRLLQFLTSDATAQEAREVPSTLTNACPLATGLIWDYLSYIWADSWTNHMWPPDKCHQLEKLFWTNPNSTIAPGIFRDYMLVGEFRAAKAFYEEAMKLPFDAIDYSARMQSPRWTLAMFEEDDAAMDAAASVNPTGSHQDFMVQINNAVYHKDYRKAEALIRTGIERYGAGNANAPSTLEMMRRILARRDALANPKDAAHDAAVGYLTRFTNLPAFQWVLIKNCGLSQQDAIKFLGGDNVQSERRLMIQYLQKDRAGFEKTLWNMKRPLNPNVAAMAGWLRSKLLNLKPSLEAASARPAAPPVVEDLVLAKLRQQK